MSAATATPAKKEEKTGLLATVANNARQYGIVGALLVIVVAFEVLTGGVLLKPNSFVSLIQQNAYVIILAIGMVMVIIATHIDLSVGSLVAFIGGVCALLMERAGVNWMLAIVIALVVGLIVGVWQGFWVAVIGIPGFITTLAGMLIFRGLATVIVGESVPITSLEFRGIARNYLPNILGWWGPFDGLTIVLGILCIVGFAWSQLRKRARVAKVGLVPEPMSLTVLKIVLAAVVIAFVTYLLASSGNADQGGTPIMLVIVGVLVFIYNFILTKTVFGRHVYAVGGNRKAAILSGINTRRVDFLLFVHMGFLSAVAAVCMLSRLACNAHIAADLPGPICPRQQQPYIRYRSVLPSSSLAPAVAASVSLAFHPATAFQPLHPMTTSKHSEKTIVAQLNSEPSLLASTSDCQSQITQAKQVNAYIREVERAVSFMAEKVL